MKITGIIISSPYKFKNNLSSRDERYFINSQNTDNIAFKANVVKLNKAVFVQRNIIRQDDSLGKFVDRIFGKIYQHDSGSNYELIINPQLNTYTKNLYTINYRTIFPLKIYPEQKTHPIDVTSYMESLIPKGKEYQKQVLDAVNKIRSKTHSIFVQYGFDPKELTEGYIDVKNSIYKRFDELLKDPSVKKEKHDYYDILVLTDKDNTDSVIKLFRNNILHPKLRYSDGIHEVSEFRLSYKDSKINYGYALNGPYAKIITNDGNELVFDYWMPRKDIHSGNALDYSLILDKDITTLRSLTTLWSHIIDYDKPFYDIKDYNNNILYTFKYHNGVDELASVYDLNKDALLINNKITKDKAIALTEEKDIALGTSLYTNLLQPKKPMGACVVLPYDIRKNFNAIKQELEPHILNGVGTGFDLSETKDPVKVLTSLNELLKEYDGKTQRPPAGIAILDVTHNDIFKFIRAKRDVNFDKWRFNISVAVPNDFIQKVANNENIRLMNGKEVPAKSIYSDIIKSMHRCGEPGIVFKDNVEAANPVPNHKYKGMASCAEIGLENGEMCLFSHINLSKFLDKTTNVIDFESMKEAVENLSRLLDNVININLAEKVGEDNIASQKRRFGIGVCGFADLLAEMGIPYGSTQAQKVLANCLEVINYSSKKASMNLSKEKGSFPLFEESRYNERDFVIKHRQDSPINESLWDKLYNDIQVYGLRNATTTALPPTGSSSRIVDASYSIEPYFDLRNNKIFNEKLDELNLSEQQKQQVIDTVNKTGSCQDIEFLPRRFRDVFKLGNEINYSEHLQIVGTAQRFIDDGISKTVNFENSATPDDIDKAVKMAYDLKLKGIAVFRDGCLAERSSK